jgi:hypothetical protein
MTSIAVFVCRAFVKPMRLPKFPLVNDDFLAEALRQLIPVAQEGVAAVKTYEAAAPLLRAHIALEMWCRQKRGRAKLLGGPLPEQRDFPDIAPPDPTKPQSVHIIRTAPRPPRTRKPQNK